MAIDWGVRALAMVMIMVGFVICAYAQVENPERVTIPAGPWRIAGKVVNAKTGAALASVRVTIAEVKNRQSVQSLITGAGGDFEFRVPAGKYSLQGDKRGFTGASYNQHEGFSTAIVTGSEYETETLVLRLAANAVLAGQVFDEFQEPVRNAEVSVYRENRLEGVSRIDLYRNGMTDDQGRYEFTPIDEGTYFVSVSTSPWYAVHAPPSNGGSDGGLPTQVDASLDVVYPVTYYGDATETEGALPIPVRGGDHLEADVHLSPAPSLRLLVHVPENGAQGIGINLLRSTFDREERTEQRLRYQMLDSGVMEISGVAAGHYSLQMFGARAKKTGEFTVESGGEVDMSSAAALSQVKMNVQIAGGQSSAPNMTIGLRDKKGRAQIANVDAAGEANFADVVPGSYDLVANSQTRAYSVTRLASEAGTVAGHTLNVPADAALQLTVTLAGGVAAVEGFAKRDGKTVAGAMIVLVPKNPEADRDRFRRDQSDLDGSFSLRDVIPGAYTVVAIDQGWELNWSEPAVIAQYLAKGQPVEVRDGATGTVQIEGAVEVQK